MSTISFFGKVISDLFGKSSHFGPSQKNAGKYPRHLQSSPGSTPYPPMPSSRLPAMEEPKPAVPPIGTAHVRSPLPAPAPQPRPAPRAPRTANAPLASALAPTPRTSRPVPLPPQQEQDPDYNYASPFSAPSYPRSSRNAFDLDFDTSAPSAPPEPRYATVEADPSSYVRCSPAPEPSPAPPSSPSPSPYQSSYTCDNTPADTPASPPPSDSNSCSSD